MNEKALNSYDVTVGGNDKSVRILEIFQYYTKSK